MTIPYARMRRGHVPREWLIFFGDTSFTFLPIRGIRNMWRYIMHLMDCRRCRDGIDWAPRGNLPPPIGPRRRYTRRVWGMRRWRRGRLNMTSGRRQGRLQRVSEDVVLLGNAELPQNEANNNNHSVIGEV